jgi:hypothetical protein
LHLPVRQCLAAISAFAIGAVVVVLNAFKIKYIVSPVGRCYDEQWDAYPLWIIGIIELDTSLICVPVPALRPFFARYFPSKVVRCDNLQKVSYHCHENVEMIEAEGPRVELGNRARDGPLDGSPLELLQVQGSPEQSLFQPVSNY